MISCVGQVNGSRCLLGDESKGHLLMLFVDSDDGVVCIRKWAWIHGYEAGGVGNAYGKVTTEFDELSYNSSHNISCAHFYSVCVKL